MKWRVPAFVAMLCCWASLPAAQAPDVSLRPVSRADLIAPQPAVFRPKLRPVQTAFQKKPSQGIEIGLALSTDKTLTDANKVTRVSSNVMSLRPTTRPRSIFQKAMARKREEAKGRLCGIAGVQGETVGTVSGNGACGIKGAVRVTHVSGVRLSSGALMDCNTAAALKQWVDQGMKPAVGSLGGGVEMMRVAAHYSCRTRNNRPGAPLSEHGKGRAIDLSAFNLRNGETISVLSHWNSGEKGKALREMHAKACGPFGTVLGPNADRFHRDHFHFDTARHRSGSYCR